MLKIFTLVYMNMYMYKYTYTCPVTNAFFSILVGEEESGSSNNILLPITITLALIVVGFVVGFMVYRKRMRNKNIDATGIPIYMYLYFQS